MNAKTTKFLAVFAVLAMAFAAVAVFAPAESDAVEAQSVWTTTPAAGDNWSLTLGSDAIIPTDGQTIDGKKVYYVNTDMSLVMSKDADLSVGGTLIMLKSGVHVNVQVPQTHEKTIAFAVAGVDESEDAKGNTVLTFYGDYTGTDFANWVGEHDKGFNYPTKWPGEAGEGKAIVGNQTIGLSKENGGGNYEFECGVTVDGNEKKVVYMTYADTDCAWYNDKGYFSGTFQYVYQWTVPGEAGAIWNLKDATGVIGSYNQTNKLDLNGFTGVIKMTSEGKVIIEKWISGDIKVIAGGFEFGSDSEGKAVPIAEGSKLTFEQGTTIPASFSVSFVRYVVDTYTFTNRDAVKAGVGGFTIAPGENGFELSGNIDGAPSWKFAGAASFTGIIDAKDKDVTIEADENYDFTFKSATVYTSKLTLTYGAAIADDTVVQINKGLTLGNGSLKIGDGAYVRVYGELKLGDTSKIYSAGNVVADTMTIGNNPVAEDKAYSGVFVYQDGSIKVSDLKLTKLEEVRMAYVYLTGAGVLGINGNEVISNDATTTGGDTAKRTGGYYEYYCMVFYPVAAQDVLNLKAQSGIVGGIETDADLLSKPDINYDLQYAKYNINYETRTPTFVIEYKETYKVILTNVITKYTITDSEGKSVYIASDDLSAMLIYGETYNLNGKVKDNKYTYTSTINTADDVKQPFDYESPILTTFEQTRMAQTIKVGVGLAQTIYIKINQDAIDPAVAVGDLILSYSVDGEEFDVYAEEIDKVADVSEAKFLGGTFKIYNTDRVLVKIADKKYFLETPTITAGLKDDETTPITKEETEAGWKFALVAEKSGDDRDASVLGVAEIKYDLAKVKDTFILKNLDGVTGTIKITLQFEDYYQGSSKHAQTIEIIPATTPGQESPVIYVNETYFMTWEDVDGVKYKMTYPNPDKTKTEPLVYNEEDVVEVVNKAERVTSVTDLKGTTYTYQLTKIRYADIENKTGMDLYVKYGDSEIFVEKGKKLTKEEGLPLDANYDNEDKLVYNYDYLVLSAKGYAISSWTGTYTKANETVGQPDVSVSITGSGPSSTVKLVGLENGKLVTISSIQATQNLYQVMVDDQQRPYVGEDYTRTGHYNDKMYLFPTAESGKTVFGINVYLADPTKPDLKGDLWCTATESDDGKYSYYYMPDSDVVLEVIVDQSTYNVNFYDQDGAPAGETIPVEPYSVHTLAIPAKFGYVATAAEIVGDIEGDFVFNPETQTVTFEMPNRNVVINVTYDEGGPYSDDMEIFVSKATDGVKVTIISNDTLPIQSGYLTIRYYVLVEEDGIYGLMPVDMKSVEFATSGAGIIESMTVSLAEEESYDAIYYVAATFVSLSDDVLKSDTLAYKM